jgi:hypothetical protein
MRAARLNTWADEPCDARLDVRLDLRQLLGSRLAGRDSVIAGRGLFFPYSFGILSVELRPQRLGRPPGRTSPSVPSLAPESSLVEAVCAHCADRGEAPWNLSRTRH